MPTARLLADLLRALPDATPEGGGPGTTVASITSSSREVTPGALFVALRGTRVDGHEFVDDAVARGAAAVMVEDEGVRAAVPVVRVPDTRRALAALAAEWHGRPADRLPLVGITGTVGRPRRSPCSKRSWRRATRGWGRSARWG